MWWALLLGLWAGRASAVAPADWQQIIDIAIAIGLALIVALAYRRWMRGVVRSRRGS